MSHFRPFLLPQASSSKEKPLAGHQAGCLEPGGAKQDPVRGHLQQAGERHATVAAPVYISIVVDQCCVGHREEFFLILKIPIFLIKFTLSDFLKKQDG